MEEKLVVYQAAKDVGQAVHALVKAYNTFRAIRKKEKIDLINSIELYRSKVRTHATGELVRANIKEIADTQRYIDSMNLSGVALERCMYQLNKLADELDQILEDFKQSI